MKDPIFISYKALSIFIIILLVQPVEMTFFAIRPSDLWLWFCLYHQYFNGFFDKVVLENRLVKYYGLILGGIAIIGTISQAAWDGTSFQFSYLFHFYRFFRFVLIFKLIENIILYNDKYNIQDFFKHFSALGFVIIILGFFEYYAVQPFQNKILELYYMRPEYTMVEYLINVERLAGLLGNPNATALVIATILPFPILVFINNSDKLFLRIIYSILIFFSIYTIVVMSGSRTAILSLLIAIIVFVFGSPNRIRKAVIPISLIIMFLFSSYFIYDNYVQKIKFQNRILNVFRGEGDEGQNIETSISGIGEISGRGLLWQNRIETFKMHGNPVALLFGMGYTKVYDDYSDNGFLGAFINNGISGLFLKFYLYFLLLLGMREGIHLYREDQNYIGMALILIISIYLVSELTIDSLEHYKLGQLFYLFISLLILLNKKNLVSSGSEVIN